MSGKLKNGGIGANGGARKGAGRKPEWLKEKCQKLLEDNKLYEFLSDVAKGETFTMPGGEDGTILSPAPIRDRLKAVEIIMDRAFGKSIQPVDAKLEVSFEEFRARLDAADVRIGR